jgi:dethiobiotin synthetase
MMSPSRPPTLLVVAGTGTEVGKTWVASQLITDLRTHQVTVAARKPAQSYDPSEGPTDADVLAAASAEPATVVCPEHRWYPRPLAPPMAADSLGRPAFRVVELADELAWGEPAPAVGLVESAGGVRSPLARDGDTVTLVDVLQPHIVVLVADAGLGTINSVRLSTKALLTAHGTRPVFVHLNRFDPLDEVHSRNLDWLRDRERMTVGTTIADLSMYVRRLTVGSSDP